MCTQTLQNILNRPITSALERHAFSCLSLIWNEQASFLFFLISVWSVWFTENLKLTLMKSYVLSGGKSAPLCLTSWYIRPSAYRLFLHLFEVGWPLHNIFHLFSFYFLSVFFLKGIRILRYYFLTVMLFQIILLGTTIQKSGVYTILNVSWNLLCSSALQ